MALELYIPPCIKNPVHPHHPPPAEKPLRIQIEGPLVSIQKLVPKAKWHTDVFNHTFPQPAGPLLARLVFEKIFGRQAQPEKIVGDLVIRDEYLGWVMEGGRPLNQIDYYGVTFDHLVPLHDDNPEVLQINIIEMDDDGGVYANEHLPYKVNPADYTGSKVLAVPRCCQKRKGTQDQSRINFEVVDRGCKEPVQLGEN
ncbi:hypothetical protein ED733_000140 [Metarhizium rileyi]|uniref:Uncharacterized protein n=1 Tax=Metarhizium rileyi (strain RCEF 4871) TaxID=1649241 RepID=A0A5C6FXD2_METRR|nr:hypothetical protein ED733_000140 [Metarhizium rileyi]